jgi:hypothetical protein
MGIVRLGSHGCHAGSLIRACTGILARPRLLMQRRRQRDLGRGEVKSDWRGRDRILQYTVRPTFVHHYGVYNTDTSFWTKRTLSLCVVGVKLKQSSGWAAFKPRLGNRLGLTSALSLSITYIAVLFMVRYANTVLHRQTATRIQLHTFFERLTIQPTVQAP